MVELWHWTNYFSTFYLIHLIQCFSTKQLLQDECRRAWIRLGNILLCIFVPLQISDIMKGAVCVYLKKNRCSLFSPSFQVLRNRRTWMLVVPPTENFWSSRAQCHKLKGFNFEQWQAVQNFYDKCASFISVFATRNGTIWLTSNF